MKGMCQCKHKNKVSIGWLNCGAPCGEFWSHWDIWIWAMRLLSVLFYSWVNTEILIAESKGKEIQARMEFGESWRRQMFGDKVGQNVVSSTAVDPEKKSDEHVPYFKSLQSTAASHEMTITLIKPCVCFRSHISYSKGLGFQFSQKL